MILESGKREWDNTTYEMPETTSKDDIIGWEDSFPCKKFSFIIYSLVIYHKNNFDYESNSFACYYK